jgi:hypothetical protein
MVPSRYPTPMGNLSGKHDRIMNPEPWRVAAKRQPHVPNPQGADADLRPCTLPYDCEGRSCASLDGRPRPRRSTLGVGEPPSGCIECVGSVGQLEARARVVGNLLWPPYRKGVMDMTADVGEAEAVVISSQRRARSFERVAPRIVLNDPHLPRPPPGVEAFSFWRSRSGPPTPGRFFGLENLGALSQKENPRQSTHA